MKLFEVTIDGRELYSFLLDKMVVGWDSSPIWSRLVMKRQELRYALLESAHPQRAFMFLNQDVQEKRLISEKLTTQIVEDGII